MIATLALFQKFASTVEHQGISIENARKGGVCQEE
jgi:hypothetical protein